MDILFKETPKPYGTFHIISLIISLIFFVFCFILANKRNNKKDSVVVLIITLLLIITEIWKQITRTKLNGGVYPFGIFPFQLCSIPMYLGILPIFLKEGKFKETIYKYITFTGLIGGLAMLTVPVVILTNYVLYTIHSLFWHMMLVGQSIYLIHARKYGNHIFKDIIPCIPILAVVVATAVILNSTDYGFNLISLSTKFVNDPPILNQIYQSVSYPVYVALVFSGLVAGLLIADFVVFIIRKIFKGKKRNEN